MFEQLWMIPLFNADGGAVAAPDAGQQQDIVDPSSVETGNSEPDAGSAPASDQQDDDVTKQQSFAARLNEERRKIEEQYTPHKQVYSKAE